MKKRLTFAACCALSLFSAMFVLSCSNPSDGSQPPVKPDAPVPAQPEGVKPSTNAQHIAMISKLAGYPVDTGAPKDSNGTELPATFNPLNNAPAAVLNKQSELFIAGLDGDDEVKNFSTYFPANGIFDEVSEDNLSAVWKSDDKEFEWTILYKKSFAADADADGKDELAIVYATLPYTPTGGESQKRKIKFMLYDGTPSIEKDKVLADKELLTVEETEFQKFYHNDHVGVINASLDIDAGRYFGIEEYQFAVSVMGQVIIVGSKTHNYVIKNSLQMPKGEYQILNLASGDTDGDGTDEILALNGLIGTNLQGSATLYVLDNELKQTHTVPVSTNDGKTMYSGSIDAGDSDGDGKDEIVCCGNTSAERVYTIVLDFDDVNKRFFPVAWADTLPPGCFSVGCAAFDYDGDGLDEFVGYTTLYDDLNARSGNTLKTVVKSLTDDGMYLQDCLATGQFNNSSGTTVDTCEDVAFLVYSGDHLHLRCWNAPGSSMESTTIDTYNDYKYHPCIAAVNYDDDSHYIRFTGRELLYTDPHVIAFLSCYPYWEGIDMSGGGNAGSSFSIATTNSIAQEKTIGLSLGMQYSYSFGKENIYKQKFAVEVEGSFDRSWGSEDEQSVTKTFESGEEDAVIFTSIPYDVYYYEVLASPSDENLTGEIIEVSVPRAPIIKKTTVAFYNAYNGGGQDITTENLISHTIGNPRSYPGPAFVRQRIEDKSMIIYNNDQYITPGCGIPAVNVGDGGKSTSIQLEWSHTNNATVAWDFSMKVSSETELGKHGIGLSAGFHYGESYTVSSGDSTAFSGAIGNLPAEQADKAFPFSLFVYKKNLEGTSDMVLVLEYCYEGV